MYCRLGSRTTVCDIDFTKPNRAWECSWGLNTICPSYRYCRFPAPQPDNCESGEERSLCWTVGCQGGARVGGSAREGEEGAKGDSRAGRAGTSLAEAPDEASHSSFSQIGCFHSNLMLRGHSCSTSEESLCTGWGGNCRGGTTKKRTLQTKQGN